jgi:hypothetical protein
LGEAAKEKGQAKPPYLMQTTCFDAFCSRYRSPRRKSFDMTVVATLWKKTVGKIVRAVKQTTQGEGRCFGDNAFRT